MTTQALHPPRPYPLGTLLFTKLTVDLSRRAHQRVYACGLALAAFLIAAAFSWALWPVPRVHDEFSYLLAADTFASGRLANPPHPYWEHFETFHVLQQPNYASKYPPGQGLLLALGQVLCGEPIVGVWLGSALLAAVVWWMLGGWLPPRWALVGGAIAALHPMIHARWSAGFWGGALAMTGGALVCGALPRIKQFVRRRDAAILAVGAIVLAATRPYEGFVLCCCAGATLLWWLVRSNEISLSTKLARVVWPATLVLSLGLAALGYYNYRVTGNPWKLPYQLHLETYARSPVFLWQTPYPEKQYRNEQLRNFHNGWELADHAAQQTLTGFYRAKLAGTRGLWEFFLGAMLTIPLVMLPGLLTSRKLRFAFVAFAAVYAASLFVPWMFPHYFAPAAPLLVLLVVSGLRWLRVATRRMRPISRWLAPALLLLLALSTANLLFRFARYEPVGWQYDRARILAELEDAPHRHLVLVRYGPRHNSHNEWVTNRADLDAAKVVWAREISPDSDAALRNYYADRQAWLLEADAPRPRLVPYTPR